MKNTVATSAKSTPEKSKIKGGAPLSGTKTAKTRSDEKSPFASLCKTGFRGEASPQAAQHPENDTQTAGYAPFRPAVDGVERPNADDLPEDQLEAAASEAIGLLYLLSGTLINSGGDTDIGPTEIEKEGIAMLNLRVGSDLRRAVDRFVIQERSKVFAVMPSAKA